MSGDKTQEVLQDAAEDIERLILTLAAAFDYAGQSFGDPEHWAIRHARLTLARIEPVVYPYRAALSALRTGVATK